MRLLLWLLAALAVLAAPAPAFAQERIVAPGGVAIDKPDGWTVQPIAPAVEKLRGLGFNSPAFRSAVEKGGMPFLTLTKYPAGHAGINPTIEIKYEAPVSSGPPPSEAGMLAAAVDAMRRDFGPIEILDELAEVQFAGAPSTHVRIACRSRSRAGKQFEKVVELWITHRGGYAIWLKAEYDRDAPAKTMLEIDGAVRGFQIEEPGPPPTIWAPSARRGD
jgi:hypothetical protein